MSRPNKYSATSKIDSRYYAGNISLFLNSQCRRPHAASSTFIIAHLFLLESLNFENLRVIPYKLTIAIWNLHLKCSFAFRHQMHPGPARQSCCGRPLRSTNRGQQQDKAISESLSPHFIQSKYTFILFYYIESILLFSFSTPSTLLINYNMKHVSQKSCEKSGF